MVDESCANIDYFDHVLCNKVGDSIAGATSSMSDLSRFQPDALDVEHAGIHLEEEFPSLFCFIMVLKLNREDAMISQGAGIDVDQ